MITNVYCFPGFVHKFLRVSPEVFLPEVERQVPGAQVKAFYPAYQRWLVEPGIQGPAVDELRLQISEESKSATRVVMIGFSMGAHLGTLLGNLISATHVLGYATPSDLRSVNLGARGRGENLDERYFDLLPNCTGIPKVLLVTDESQQGEKNAHHPDQANRLAHIANLTIERRKNLNFADAYFPEGGFANDLQQLLS